MTNQPQHFNAAYELGRNAARSTASWITDGNDTDESRRRKLEMIDAGQLEDIIRYPNLSGEFADDPTPLSLAREITGDEHPSADVIDTLADAFDAGVSDEFEFACIRELSAWLS